MGKGNSKLIKSKYFVIFFLIVLIVIVHISKLNIWVAENIYARGISRFWTGVFARITSLSPIALFELLTILLVFVFVFFIVLIVKSIRKKNWKRLSNTIYTIIVMVLSITLVYGVTASANYYREDIKLNVYEDNPSNEEYTEIANHFLDDFNYLARTLARDENGVVMSPYSDKELAELIRKEFEKFNDNYYNSYIPKAKPSIFSIFLSYNSIAGIYFAPTAEAVYNNIMPDFRKPFTIAHELAHASGVMRENEANLIASYITLNSENDFIRYSGYHATFGYMASTLFFIVGQEEYMDFLQQYDSLIDQDYSHYYDFWNSYDSIFDTISNYINDLYLRIQGQSDGTGSYTGSYNPEIIDSGEIGDQGEIIYEISYSQLQRIYFDVYYSN